jgi:thiol-disulfide isomerase/thioredoxin
LSGVTEEYDVTEPNPPREASVLPRLVLTLGLAILGVGISVWVFLSNGAPQAGECPVQTDAGAALDAAATGELAALMGTGEGRGYRSLTFKDETGGDISIAAFSGKRLLVNFWASWCVPCREEMPALDALAGKYNSENFEVVTINLDMGEDGLDKARQFMAEGGFSHLPLYADNSFAAFERLRTAGVAMGLPATLLLDETGCELAVLQGPAEWDHADGEAVVEALIGLEV